MSDNAFLSRVMEKMPRAGDPPTDYVFKHWSVPGKVTDEALGILPVPGVDPERFLARVMELDKYVGSIPHVVESRTIADARFTPPNQARFYQRVKIPLLGEVQQDLAIERLEKNGWLVAAWHLLEAENEALPTSKGMRCSYNDGAWLVAPGVVAYALSSAPKRDDVGFIKWKAMTAGADAAATKVIRDNISAMAKFAAQS